MSVLLMPGIIPWKLTTRRKPGLDALGCRFTRTSTGYWCTKDGDQLHRVLWTNFRGVIPDGCHIHHRNENKSDNRFCNLQCLSATQHHRLHGPDHGRRINEAVRGKPKVTRDCARCGKEFASWHWAKKFCSRACNVAYWNAVTVAKISARRLIERLKRRAVS